ncbi:MAG: cobalamin-dependent protein, partial [Proteobacteria bacterium]|nr:cobalamin-dependent protein [Pseudomonadota bacterium]
MLKVNPKKLRPYGDRLDDGQMQLSFTLPVAASPEAREAARRYVEGLGLRDVSICAMDPMGSSFAYFVAYGRAQHTIDITKIIVPKVEVPLMKYEDLVAYMSRNIERPIVVIGACTGSDAHTVGIDAIMNMKGFAHDYGLERYPLFKAVNLRSQLSNASLIDKAVELGADAMLVSQVVTQRDSHIHNLKDLHELIKGDKRLKRELIVIIGGPRLDHAHALKLGFDAGFGPGTRPSQVASFIVHEFMKRHGMKEKHAGAEPGAVQPMPRPHHRGEPSPQAHAHAKAHAEAHGGARGHSHIGERAHDAHRRHPGDAAV